jgi:hypothetical protein
MNQKNNHSFFRVILTGLCVIALSSAIVRAESVGLNLSVTGDVSTELNSKDEAGAAGVAAANWNNLPGVSGTNSSVKNSAGAEVKGLTASWGVPTGDTAWRSRVGKDWGFKDNNLKLQRGFIQLGGNISVTGISYPKYDVYVYFGADANGGSGKATLKSSAGGVDPKGSYYLKFQWLNGEFVKSTSTTKDNIEKGNYVVFTGNAAKDINLEWEGNLEGGWLGVTGIQIVATP